MWSYALRRFIEMIPVMIGMSLIVFGMIRAIPGDPALVILGEKATPEAVQALRLQLGLDQPVLTQYVSYVKDIISGDWGTSVRTQQPIIKEVVPYFAATIELALFSMGIAVIVGVNAGIIAAWKKASWFDYIAMLVALIGVSMPIFWLGLMEQWIFAEKLGILPSIGRMNSRDPIEAITGFYLLDTWMAGNWRGFWDICKHLLLPGIALGTIPMAIIARMTRSSMLEVMKADYVRTAKAKGLSEFWVVYKHALKNAFVPILTVIGLQMGSLLGGAVLTETIFGWPGIGRYIYDAIGFRDYPVIQSVILLISTTFILLNLLVDLLYAKIDPRIHYQ